jgi:hypothetical protein
VRSPAGGASIAAQTEVDDFIAGYATAILERELALRIIG